MQRYVVLFVYLGVVVVHVGFDYGCTWVLFMGRYVYMMCIPSVMYNIP